ncbi:trypsin-like peptidase domain-containing protein [Streptomyces sp. NPDC005917]|uniref:trypsin-like peptidase domain-containing protein n=1 Tax=unclassified Streptomyces TaxID=2593676 RepID=UPI0033E6C6AA
MAGRGPRTGSGRRTADGTREARQDTWPVLGDRLVRVRDLAGRPRGTGFLADHHGTLVTSHEAVDGLARIVLHAAGDRTCVVDSDAVTPLPAHDLALIRTEGLCVDPLPITVRERIPTGTYVRIAADRWREARVLAATQVTYTATDRFHLLDDALELAIGTAGRDALRLGGGAAGGPVLDAETGAVLGVLGTALRSGQRDVGFAVPLHHPASAPLADLLARNAETVPAYGIDLNLAGILELTATSVGQDGPPGALAGYIGRTGAPHRGAGLDQTCGYRRAGATSPNAPAAPLSPAAALSAESTDPVQPVERSATSKELSSFAEGTGTVLALVGAPGTGRTTELAALAHEAARRSLGPGQGELDRESFEAVFPWGPVPAHLGGGSGWASAVLTEGLLVPAGGGYRFAHEELADWIQGMHLDLDEALPAPVHRPRAPEGAHPLPVPHHRVGPVVQALVLLDRQYGPAQLAPRLNELAHALDLDPGSWWAARLLTQTLLRLPDATPYIGVLRLLADRVVGRQRTAPAEFGPDFWTALALPDAERFDLLRRLVRADEPLAEAAGIGRFGARPTAEESEGAVPRYLDAVARLLAADPTAVQPYLTRWFEGERPLPAMPHATVATAAQALLHTHRHRALDDLTEVLVDAAHRRGDELLAVLAEDEPSAVCRAVDRWAHDERPARRVAAVAYGLRAAPHVRSEPDRELLRYAALALLARPADCTLHGGALALLVRDPRTRARHLPQALRHFATGDPQLSPSALVPALATHPDDVLEAFRARLREPGAGQVLRALADVTTPALAHRVTELVLEAVDLRPETAGQVAGFVERRLDHGAGARAVLLPLVTGLLDHGPEPVRAALATVLGSAGTPASRPLRREMLEFLLDHEQDPGVLDALLHAAAVQREDDGDQMRELVRRTGLMLVRTPDGATRFDRGLVDLGRHVPGFAALMARWLTDTPEEWAAVVGPSTRRMLGNLAGVRVPA